MCPAQIPDLKPTETLRGWTEIPTRVLQNLVKNLLQLRGIKYELGCLTSINKCVMISCPQTQFHILYLITPENRYGQGYIPHPYSLIRVWSEQYTNLHVFWWGLMCMHVWVYIYIRVPLKCMISHTLSTNPAQISHNEWSKSKQQCLLLTHGLFLLNLITAIHLNQ